MLKVQKNDKAFQELNACAKSKSLPLKELLKSDEHLNEVTEIFYKHMPKLVRFSMRIEKFKEFYKTNREAFIAKILL